MLVLMAVLVGFSVLIPYIGGSGCYHPRHFGGIYSMGIRAALCLSYDYLWRGISAGR